MEVKAKEKAKEKERGPREAKEYIVHTVRPNDTLMLLSTKYRVSNKAIMKANGVFDNITLLSKKEMYIPFFGQSFSFDIFIDATEQ